MFFKLSVLVKNNTPPADISAVTRSPVVHMNSGLAFFSDLCYKYRSFILKNNE